jgi:phosphatidylglycerol:prolipoprotein diacylglycerol transferase
MLLASLALLPKWTWTVNPVLFAPAKAPAAALIAAIGVVSLLLGLKRKITDQTTTGVLFLAMAGAIFLFMPEHLQLRYYSLLFVVVFLGGHALLNWQVKRGGGSPDVASDFIVYGVIGVLVGARLGHVLFYDLDHAIQNPLWVLEIWTGGLASHGAVIGLIIAMYLFTKRRGVPFLEGADRFAFSATLGATVVRIGNLLNSEIVGRVVPDQSWGMKFPRADIPGAMEQPSFSAEELAHVPYRYPSQLFEIALGTAVFVGLLIADRAMGKEKRPRGAMISWFFLLYFGGRLFTEQFKKIEALPETSLISMGQWLSFPGVLLGLYGLYRAFKRREPTGWVEPGTDPNEDEDEDEESEDEESEDEDEGEQAPIKGRDDDTSEDEDEDEESEDEDEDEDDDDDGDAKRKPAADPDVESEFEDGKLKKRRDP